MFSGIVEEVGSVESITPAGGTMRLTIAAPLVAADTGTADSVCVNGVCLTVVGKEGDRLSFDAVPETLARSSLGALRAGSRVNLERSLAVGDRIGGHFVQGHVDATAAILAIEQVGDEAYEIAFETDEALTPLLVEKGSISLDGISLTLAQVSGSRFVIAIIPFTWENTNLCDRRVGDRVNVETDILGRQVVHALAYLQTGGQLADRWIGG